MPYADIYLGLLVGGHGTRLGGIDKARLRDGNASFVERLVSALGPAVAEVVLSGRGDQAYPEVDCRLLPDRRAGKGPLAGLETLLGDAPAPWCFLVACDMPRIDAAVLDRLAMCRVESSSIVVATTPFGWEPTCALYHVDLLPRVSKLLDANRRALHTLLHDVGCTEAQLPEALAARLLNVNEPGDHP
ncbi:MAG: molybdenum cofactor guanylyltransferase [Myxococcota bacterium]